MKIQSNELSFQRALTTQEKTAYVSCISETKKKLNIKETVAILFDYCVPAEQGRNIGIGTTFSDNAQKFVQFIKDYCGITAIQLNPQGILKDNSVSPYNATSLSIGEHIIDLFKLSEKEYEGILPFDKIKPFLIDEKPDGLYKINYKRLVRQDYQKDEESFVFSKLLRIAFNNFQKRPDNSVLKQEFKLFCKENSYRLEKESLYYALAEKYKSTQWQNWGDYKFLFMEPDSKKTYQTVNYLKKEHKTQIDYFNFVQFIADKQQKNSKKLFNQKGIKVLGDIPISFSPAEQWANKSLFSKDYCFGFFDGYKYQDWGSPAPDLDEFYMHKSSMLDLFRRRLFANLKRYDGIRIDVAWEMFNPCVVKWNPIKSYGDYIGNLGTQLFDTIEEMAKHVYKNKYNPENIYLELLGADEISTAVSVTKNKFPHILVTGICDSVKKYLDVFHYRPDKCIIGIGTHDNPSLVEVSERVTDHHSYHHYETENNAKELQYNMKTSVNPAKIPALYRTLKLAELFTTEKQYIKIFDILGTNQEMNNWDSLAKQFWVDRVPINYEQTYFANLIKFKGLNMPESLLYAIKAKGVCNIDKNLINQLRKFASILHEDGPLTEESANKAFGAK